MFQIMFNVLYLMWKGSYFLKHGSRKLKFIDLVQSSKIFTPWIQDIERLMYVQFTSCVRGVWTCLVKYTFVNYNWGKLASIYKTLDVQ